MTVVSMVGRKTRPAAVKAAVLSPDEFDRLKDRLAALPIDQFKRLKNQLRNAIKHDLELSGSHRHVGEEIADHLNLELRYAWIPQERIARNLGFSVRTVRRGVDALGGYYKIERVGRGHRYWPIWGPRLIQSIPDKLSGQDEQGIADNRDRDSGQSRPQKADKKGPQSLDNPERPYAGASLARESKCAMGDGDSPAGQSEIDCRWNAVKRRLEQALGKDIVISWFGRVRVADVTNNVVTLSAPTRFIRDWIEGYFGHLLAAWHAEIPAVRRIRLIEPGGQCSDRSIASPIQNGVDVPAGPAGDFLIVQRGSLELTTYVAHLRETGHAQAAVDLVNAAEVQQGCAIPKAWASAVRKITASQAPNDPDNAGRGET